jgi:hypothetical protein
MGRLLWTSPCRKGIVEEAEGALVEAPLMVAEALKEAEEGVAVSSEKKTRQGKHSSPYLG